MWGDPYLARLLARAVLGFGGPKRKIRGQDFAGRVEAVGRGVTRLRPGDEVYGDLGFADGAFAEYVCVPDDRQRRYRWPPAPPWSASATWVGSSPDNTS